MGEIADGVSGTCSLVPISRSSKHMGRPIKISVSRRRYGRPQTWAMVRSRQYKVQYIRWRMCASSCRLMSCRQHSGTVLVSQKVHIIDVSYCDSVSLSDWLKSSSRWSSPRKRKCESFSFAPCCCWPPGRARESLSSRTTLSRASSSSSFLSLFSKSAVVGLRFWDDRTEGLLAPWAFCGLWSDLRDCCGLCLGIGFAFLQSWVACYMELKTAITGC